MNHALPRFARRALAGRLAAAALATATWLLAGCANAPDAAPLPTVPQVELPRYLGAWYEVAMLPNSFQRQCVADTQARYRPREDGHIEVLNRCRTAGGEVQSATGIAKVVEGSANTKLRVSFFRPFYGDYWILALAEDYRWVLVGEPTRRYGWVLSRSPQIAPADLEAALARAQALGYERSAFTLTPQRQPLE